MKRAWRCWVFAAWVAVVAVGCEDAGEKARAAAEKTGEAANAARDKGVGLSDKARRLKDRVGESVSEGGASVTETLGAAREGAAVLKGKAGAALEDGQVALSEKAGAVLEGSRQTLDSGRERTASAFAELSERARERADGVEAWVVERGALIEAGRQLRDTYRATLQSDEEIVPIYQSVGDAQAQRELDTRIAGMPRVEVVDGVTVGHQRLDALTDGGLQKERGYLVLWRRGDTLVGFVYYSEKTTDVNALVTRTPALIQALNAAL